MTDVMAYFAARSLRGGHRAPAEDGAATPVLRPRLPSRYEAMAPPEAGAAGDVAGEDAFLDVEPRPRHGAPVAESAPTAEPAKFAAPAPPAAALMPRAAATPPHRIAAAPAPPLQPPRVDREPGPDDLALSLPHPGVAAANAIAAPPPSLRPVPSADPPPARAAPRSDAVTGRQPPPPAPSETGDAPDRRPNRTPTGGIAPAPSPPLAPVLAAVGAPPREGRLARVAIASQHLGNTPQPPPARPRDTVIGRSPAAPRIEVTIGRIEIRAASSPAPPRTAPRPPPMSLDDYLAKRARG
jgi:hypothetical protein